MTWPGNSFTNEMADWSYMERSSLSATKLMSRVLRASTASMSYYGHYNSSGDIWSRYNWEFVQVLYGGTLGLPIMAKYYAKYR